LLFHFHAELKLILRKETVKVSKAPILFCSIHKFKNSYFFIIDSIYLDILKTAIILFCGSKLTLFAAEKILNEDSSPWFHSMSFRTWLKREIFNINWVSRLKLYRCVIAFPSPQFSVEMENGKLDSHLPTNFLEQTRASHIGFHIFNNYDVFVKYIFYLTWKGLRHWALPQCLTHRRDSWLMEGTSMSPMEGTHARWHEELFSWRAHEFFF